MLIEVWLLVFFIKDFNRLHDSVATSLKILGHPSPQNSLANATSMPPAALDVLVPLDFDPPTGFKIYAPQ